MCDDVVPQKDVTETGLSELEWLKLTYANAERPFPMAAFVQILPHIRDRGWETRIRKEEEISNQQHFRLRRADFDIDQPWKSRDVHNKVFDKLLRLLPGNSVRTCRPYTLRISYRTGSDLKSATPFIGLYPFFNLVFCVESTVQCYEVIPFEIQLPNSKSSATATKTIPPQMSAFVTRQTSQLFDGRKGFRIYTPRLVLDCPNILSIIGSIVEVRPERVVLNWIYRFSWSSYIHWTATI
jgi:hypothetical protein